MIFGWELAGLSLGQVLAVLAGFGAGVVTLYLLRLQRRRVEVPFVRLWDQVLGEERSTRLWARLRRLLSLLVALAVVLLVASALGDPRPAGALSEGRTIVVLLDASASMQATDVEGGREEAARSAAREIVRGLAGADRVLVARMGPTTLPLGPRSGDPAELEQAIVAYEAADVEASLARGVRFALDALHGTSRPEIVIVSDGGAGEAGEAGERARREDVALRWARVGTTDETPRNVAITAFAARRHVLDRSRAQVLLELWNPSERAEDVEITLSGDGRELDVSTRRLGAGERASLVFEDLTGADRTLEARLRLADGSGDALAADDVAFARLPDRRRARVLRVSAGNVYLDATLLLDEYLDVVEAAPGDPVPEGRFDVVIYDGGTLAGEVDADAVWLAPWVDGAGPLAVAGTLARPFFDRVRTEHPLVRFAQLHDVNIAEALALRAERGDVVVGGDERGPLLLTGERGEHRFVALAFAPSVSDLPLRVAWPLLVLNAIDYLTEEESGFHASQRTDAAWHLPLPEGATRATLVAPDGREHEVPVVGGRALASGEIAGFYTLRSEAPGGSHEEVVAASLGPSREALLTVPEELSIGGEVVPPPEPPRPGLRSEPWTLLVLVALAILALEWATYHRRWTL